LKTIITLGPSTNDVEDLKIIKDKGVDFVRINMSHSSIEDLEYFIILAKKVGIPFIIDTEGSQIRTGKLFEDSILFSENDILNIHCNEIEGDKNNISLRPGIVVNQLNVGDILYVDFDTLALKIIDISNIQNGIIKAQIVSSGNLGNNKGVVVEQVFRKKIKLPVLTEKDKNAVKLGLKYDIKFIAASFIRSGEDVIEVKRISDDKMQIISKIECIDALENLDDIIEESEYLLIDRGDLSKEIPIEKIPFTQKIILHKAKMKNTGVFVATNLLESMIENRKPTRAEVHDILNTIVDGATGLVMAAETAIGKYPLGCINMLNKIIKHSELVINADEIRNKEVDFISHLNSMDYLLDHSISSSLIEPNGGKLISRSALDNDYSDEYLFSLNRCELSLNSLQDLEQIANGTYSPLVGFLTLSELESVLNNLRLPDGCIWPIPILLDIEEDAANEISINEEIALVDPDGEIVATMIVKDNYYYSKEELAEKFYGTTDLAHPGIKLIFNLKSHFLGGKITLIKRPSSIFDEYKLSPKQVRRLFEEKNWTKIVGFHTRNVIHKAHEFIQNKAIKEHNCDGIFLHPVVGEKKKGDYQPKCLIDSYNFMMSSIYKDNKAVFSTFSTYSRYGGQKEALFTAICRQNFGCSHFIIGRDHTGSGTTDIKNEIDFFQKFPDLQIQIIKFNNVYYSKSSGMYIESNNDDIEYNEDMMFISGTEARKMLLKFESPPDWFMRRQISRIIIDSLKRGEKVFV
jgi:pyruvate kinase